MYVLNGRSSLVQCVNAENLRVTTPRAISQTVDRRVEGVYSWRTGKKAYQGQKPNSPSERTDDFGHRLPKSGKSIFDTLARRREYLEQLDRTVGEVYSPSKYTSRSDNGHEFLKVDAVVSASIARGSILYKVGGKEYVSTSDSWIGGGGYTIPNFTGMAMPFATKAKPRLLTGTQLRGVQNGVYYSSNPYPFPTTVLTTVIELLKGDIPSVVKNIRKFITEHDPKRVGKYLGGESLNIQFGWTPLINEFANVLRLLLTLDEMVYGSSSFRRKRGVQGPVVNQTASFSRPLAPIGRPWGFNPTGNQYSDGSRHATLTGVETVTTTENYRFSGKFKGIAVPTRAAGKYYQRAQETLHNIGVGDPEVLWDITSWSWLVDYFATLGKSIANAYTYSPQTGRAAQLYAYWTTKVVETTSLSVTSVTVPSNVVGLSGVDGNFAVATSMIRERVTPFGFGTRFGSLSAQQWGILISLGLARSGG